MRLRTRTSRTEALVALVALATVTVGLTIAVATAPPIDVLVVFAGCAALGGFTTVLGLAIHRRQPANLVGPLLAALGLAVIGMGTAQVAHHAVARLEVVSPLVLVVLAAMREGALWSVVALALLLLLFPDGRLPGPRWRAVPPLLVACGVVFQVLGALDPTPFPPPLGRVPRVLAELAPPWLESVRAAVEPLVLLLLMCLLLAAVVSLFVRFRRADERGRRQVAWLLLAASGVFVYGLIEFAEWQVLGGPTWLSAAIGIATLVGIPAAIAVAILRYDLYDIDKALAATVTYALVSAVLLVLYTAGSFVGGLLVGPESTAAAAGATALCAAALLPVRRGVQRRGDRWLYPKRFAALAAIEDLTGRTRTGDARPEGLEAVLRTSLRDPSLRIGYVVPGREGFVDAAGSDVPADGGVVVRQAGRPVAVLAAASTPGTRELLDTVGRASIGLMDVVRLRLELAGALRDVEASRTQLVTVGERERRRLERDLHDGSQQRLVALGMALRLAQRHLDEGSVDVHGLLDQSVAELGTAVAELREIAHGLRPSRLDDGLRAALVSLAERLAVPVDLEITSGALPDDVAATAYYVASEALTNAVKHAEADRIEVRVVRSEALVEVRIADDGRGGAVIAAGTGLAGLADRVAARGGSLSMSSPLGHGTVIEAVLPCAS